MDLAGQCKIDGFLDRPSTCNPHRALVADDNIFIARIFGEVIVADMPEIKVDLAVDGLDAVRAFSHGHHAVVVMDLRMPRLDGRAAFQRIQGLCAARQWEMPAVIFCTGYAAPDFAGYVSRAGPQHSLLLKPLGPDELLTAVRGSLHLRGQ